MRFRLSRVVLAALLGVASATPSSAEPLLPFCTTPAFSPAFAKDRTGFCAGLATNDETGAVTGVRLLVTRDAGASWRTAAASGLPATDSTLIGAVVVSPRFAADHTLYVQTSLGLYASTDYGASFTLLDSFAAPGFTGTDNVTAYVESPVVPVGGGTDRVVIAYAGGDRSRRIDPPLSVPVVGAPGDDIQYLAVGTGAAETLYALTAEPDASADPARPYRDALYACDRTVTCAERLSQFPAGWYAERIWAGAGAQPPLYVQLRKVRADHMVEVRRSVDGGRTFKPWTSVNALLARYATARAAFPRVWVTQHPGKLSRMYLRIAHGGVRSPRGSSDPATEVLYTSANSGGSWTAVATTGYGGPKGARGRLGWTESDLRVGPRIEAMPDGRLFAVGGTATYLGIYCSRDGGLSWTYRCRAR